VLSDLSDAKVEKGKELSARGTVQVDAGNGRGLEFKELAGTGRYVDGAVFLDSLRLRLYGGEATVSGWIRTGGKTPGFSLKLAAKDIAAAEILSRKTALKDFMSGKASLSASIAGGMKDFADFTRTAAGSGSLRVAGGRIKGVDLLAAAAGVSGISSAVPSAPIAADGRTPETSFSDLSCDFRIEGGRIRTESLRLSSDKISLAGSAALGFDRALDFRGSLILSKDLSDRVRGTGGRFLTGSSGRVEIPVLISGPVNSPAVKIDGETLARGLAGKAVESIGRGKEWKGLLEKLLPGK
jgi:uncharacterized protein involved in outer membrane biogenesis